MTQTKAKTGYVMETERLLVRPLTAQDTEALYAVLSDAEVMRYIEPAFSRQKTAEFIASVSAATPAPVYAVVWKATDTVIGHLIYHPCDGGSWELGWILHRAFWRRGIAGELTAAVVADARKRNLPELVIECDRRQLISRHIAEKNGFRYAGEEGDLVLYRRRPV